MAPPSSLGSADPPPSLLPLLWLWLRLRLRRCLRKVVAGGRSR
jgi:hypothetical protein